MPKGSSRGRKTAMLLAALSAASIATVVICAFALRAGAAPSVPNHVLTMDFYCCSGGEMNLPPKADPSTLAKYTDWAFLTKIQYANALAGAGIKILIYTDPNRVGPKEPMFVDDDAMFVHDCNGNRISIMKPPSMRDHYLTDSGSPVTQQRWVAQVNDQRQRGHVDAVFDDDAAGLARISAMPCGMTKSKWTDRQELLVQAMTTVPVFVNGLMDLNFKGNDEFEMAPTVRLAKVSTVMGGLFETCYTDVKAPMKTHGSYWKQTENEQMLLAHAGKIFVCNESARVSGPNRQMADQAIDVRQYAEASFLLSYDPATSMVRQKFQNPSGFELEPETELVALNPVLPEPNNVDSLLSSSGAYGREFRSCYIMGASVGPCAAAVNPNLTGTVGFPYSNYHHTLVLSGGGILDGGTIATDGPAPSNLGPQTGVVAFQ